MMMALGYFIFSVSTLAYQEYQRQTEWKHPSHSIVGGRDMSQFTGIGEDTLTLTGWFSSSLTGSEYSLDALRFMADTGKAWILIQGTGRIIGNFVITQLSENHTEFMQNGCSLRYQFTLQLKRVEASLKEQFATQAEIKQLQNMLNLEGFINNF